MSSRARGRALSCVVAVAALGCGDAPVPSDETRGCAEGIVEDERHGTDCLCCHDGEFSVAGSVVKEAMVARIEVEDSTGLRLVMSLNPYDNFFQHSDVVPPLRAMAVFADGHVATMGPLAPHGACNRCHVEGGAARPIGAPRGIGGAQTSDGSTP